ncbi:hypothetical protein AZI86_16285 [Bdellovibrio bacteriovorus]|uniref:DUF4230 domain-containing protein n=1 Tax=Bdellovibrio bacteriovorus TaxID=959 RepID=A0A150WGT4_BDEBC|nr:hypothetical protein [Bdellovibrio bacteriovorus]KYG62393.1 hypothetical protein AZI86_16285 [Bdellovibrio bacteriovorus]
MAEFNNCFTLKGMKNSFKMTFLAVIIGGGALLMYSVYRTQNVVPHLLEKIFSEDVNDKFHAYATKVSGKQSLHVARLNRMEIYERTSKAKAFGFSLPDVIVSITFPVEYNYNVSLTAGWKFEKRDGMLMVYAPELSGQTPAVNVSEMKFEIKKGSFIRDENQVRERLQKELTGFLSENSIALREQVRTEARLSIEQFVRGWVASQVTENTTALPIKVLFPGENADAPPSGTP